MKRKLLIRQADRLWSKIIAYDFNQRCVLCGEPGTDAHHWAFGRSTLMYRWNIMNGVYMCRKCHDEAERYPLMTKLRIQRRSANHYEWFNALPPLEVKPMPDFIIRDIYIGLRERAKERNIPIED